MTCKAQKLFKRAGALLLILTLLLGMACVHAEKAGEQEEELSVLPLDFSAGMPLKRQYFKGNWQYEDPTISVSITRHTASLTNGNCAYWVASVKIKHASQLRTMAANRYDATGETYGDKIAKRVNETDHLHSGDLERLQEMLEAIWLSQKCILSDEP